MTLDIIRQERPTLLALVAALVLFASPFFLGDGGIAAVSAHALGIIGIGAAIKTLLRPETVDRLMLAGTGALMGLLPWITGFAAGSVITWLHLLAAAAFAARAFWPPSPSELAARAARKPHDDGAMPSA